MSEYSESMPILNGGLVEKFYSGTTCQEDNLTQVRMFIPAAECVNYWEDGASPDGAASVKVRRIKRSLNS